MKAWLLFLLIWISGSHVFAQPVSFLHTLERDQPADLYLTLDWRKLEKTKKEKAYVPASVKCMLTPRDSMLLPAKVRTRGHMRLNICSLPPLKLKIDKSGLDQYHLCSLNEMDIVHHCHESDQYDQYLLREYLAYKIWELVSPYYFSTRLVRMHYLAPDGSEAHASATAFLVENEEELLDRLQGRQIKTAIINHAALDRESFLRACLFEFMIGNTDWYIPTRHNLEFIGIPGKPLLQTIPYDFDYSGLVNAPYAAHHESLNLSVITIRYYQGWCHTEEEVRQQLQVFLDQKEKILQLPYRIPGLDERSIRHVVEYLKGFYEIVENPKKLQNQVIRHCDMWPAQE